MCRLWMRVKYIAVHYYVLGTDNKGLTMRVARKRRGLNFCNVTGHADPKCASLSLDFPSVTNLSTNLSTENLFTQNHEPERLN